jgi:polysaccharide pyruvyl transferase WcaK-like protein
VIYSLNKKVKVIKDLAYLLYKDIKVEKNKNSVLIIPNSHIVPQYDSLIWQNSSWNYFKSEFSQFTDYLFENNYIVNYFPMSSNYKHMDIYAAAEIINCSKHKEYLIKDKTNSFIETAKLFSSYDLIISQRYHGSIIADMYDIPSITISHHIKLNFPNYIDYYGINKNILIKSFNERINNLIKQTNKTMEEEDIILEVNKYM